MNREDSQKHGIRWRYIIPTGIAGGIASMILLGIAYTAGSSILFNAAYQSQKVIAVYNTIQPLPLLSTNIGLFAVGWFVLAIVRTAVFAWFYHGIPCSGVRKGLSWGIGIWLTMILWAEYYTAINLLGEPIFLAAFEFLIVLPAFLGEGSVVALIYRRALL